VGPCTWGWRHRFGGKVDPPGSRGAEEPQPGRQQRKTSLYLFDSVARRYGYVRQLMEAGGQDLKAVFAGSCNRFQAPLRDGAIAASFSTASASIGCARVNAAHRAAPGHLKRLGRISSPSQRSLSGGDSNTPRRKRTRAAVHSTSCARARSTRGVDRAASRTT